MTHWKIKWHDGFTVKLKSLPVHTCNMTGLPDCLHSMKVFILNSKPMSVW